ncbi:c-type cytochrome [Alcaligenaceae bacterium C4P045]|nr:c-type cytochrome [Alcaligenaceae bacterium C4P045]
MLKFFVPHFPLRMSIGIGRGVIAPLCAAIGAGAIYWPAEVLANQALAQKYACIACHQAKVKIVGPSWSEISARYGDGKGTVEMLSASIKSGSSGKWGPTPMPPQGRVSDADLEAISKWLLDGAK